MRLKIVLAASLVLLVGCATPALADGLIVPYYAYNFDVDPDMCSGTTCETSHGFGVSVGFMVGGLFGIEGDFGHTPSFFGSDDVADNSVTTVMANVTLGAPFGPVRPFVVGGVGLVRTDISESDVDVISALSDNTIGWNAGGGLIVFVADHFGFRGDVRHFHSFEDLDFVLELQERKLAFWRTTAGLVFRF
jgi:opacity protein-like surface antigen